MTEIYNNGHWLVPPEERASFGSSRKYQPSLSDLIDRLSIDLIKCVKIPEHRAVYEREIKDILDDIEQLTGKALFIQGVVVMALANLHIWQNESDVRNGSADPSRLLLTHRINGIRSQAKNAVLDAIGTETGKDWKVDCVADDAKEYNVEWYE